MSDTQTVLALWRKMDEIVDDLEYMADEMYESMTLDEREKFENLCADAMVLRKEFLHRIANMTTKGEQQ